MILVNASAAEGTWINGEKIEPHDARLWLNRDDQRPLAGVRLSLNTESESVHYDDSFRTCIPHASEFTSSLPSPSEQVVRNTSPDRVAAYFDAAGMFVGARDSNGASFAILTVTTNDPPVLTIKSFEYGSQPETIELEDGAILQIENLGRTERNDSDHDFLLHFKVGESIPTDARWPTNPRTCANIVEPPYSRNTVGPGCSNSDYP